MMQLNEKDTGYFTDMEEGAEMTLREVDDEESAATLAWDDDEFELPDTECANTAVKCVNAPDYDGGDEESAAPEGENYGVNDEDWLAPVAKGVQTERSRVAFSANRRNKHLPRENKKEMKKSIAAHDDNDTQTQRRLVEAMTKKKTATRCGICRNPLGDGETKFHAACIRSRELKQSGVGTPSKNTLNSARKAERKAGKRAYL